MLSLPQLNLEPIDFALPKALAKEQSATWDRMEDIVAGASLDASKVEQIHWLSVVSPFFVRTVERYSEAVFTRLFSPLPASVEQLQETLAKGTGERDLLAAIRRFRHIEMARIAGRDLLGWMPLERVLQETSAIADMLIEQALDLSKELLADRYGRALKDEAEVPLIALAMGKLGGEELNFSSDIDLIFCFPERGETTGGRQNVDFELYFGKLAQQFMRLLGENTAEGQPFRIDLRLRPFGQSGPIVSSLAALMDYYHEQGRMWERYAMVKARVLGADEALQAEVQDVLRPFVYRRYLDYSAIDALRKMKLMINQEARRKGVSQNIKLGLGGIREVEFIAQVFQLIRGGREPELQTRSLVSALSICEQHRLLDAHAVDELLHGYAYLRKVEHVLQEIDDQQTQTLPEDKLNRARVLLATGFAATDAGWQEFHDQLHGVMQSIHRHFLDAIGGEADMLSAEDSEYSVLWQDLLEDDTALDVLTEGGAKDAEACWQHIQEFRQLTKKRPSGPRGRELLAQLVPVTIENALAQKDPALVLKRVFEVLAQIMSRSTYLELLAENEEARTQLIFLCGSSPWIAHLLAKFPWLLDELIDPVQLYHLPNVSSYRNQVSEYMMRLPQNDVEAQMDTLRHVKQIFQLKVAAADLNDGVHLMRVSDHLTYLAEAIIEQVVLMAWRQLAEKHGTPPGRDESDTGFAVIAYGKLGGYELGYGSDLDLVFVCDDDISGQTDGERPIDVQQFYLRLAQRILHLCTTRTMGGVLYEVDLRLRPSGQSGLLVVRMGTYKEYLLTDAWTWELQALVRARYVFGAVTLLEKFNAIRRNVLRLKRDSESLQEDVLNMRWKMREHLWQRKTDLSDVKQMPGGMADIEFITQYLVLRWSNEFPDLCVWTDNIRILENASAHKLLPAKQANQLISAYQAFRFEAHRLALAEQGSLSERTFTEHTQHVSEAWHDLFNEWPQTED
ncbi:bifunctional [glutamate--ammonia ligase]-adenylyl-L-tyrosine phosphorylase/[glutamate--ammonia-ligase] adenylyltransferase [Aliidiomarina indica]|uniref:bifunctional [glutamate--ammonia ligase]-adenylyl-L-tyrosine phosphorylase/[glutamate--ammonia-ligase] adenylyltransferase n=1 Tax=Aliidiomarina indica TaxID=2749147 RepID=UPI00188EB65A|nr:bifunctional [glutamate--ammonia ligase]-adenylyl-L-tyrosine phosphorylase/[glutamate--ammonia-ligase] adenylyltransferase [Aliidiomarina indica]